MRRFLARGGKAEDFWKCQPGHRLAAYFADDNMFHERVLLWYAGGMKRMVLTPDFDLYVENFSGQGDPGRDFFKIKGMDFRYWSRVGGAAYRFWQDPSDEDLKDKIREAVELLGDSIQSTGRMRGGHLA